MARGGSSIPKPLRPLVGGAVLVGSVRVVDALWRRVTGRPTPVESRATDEERADEPTVVRDRLAYALLLGGAMKVARRAGLPKKDAAQKDAAKEDGGVNGRSPA